MSKLIANSELDFRLILEALGNHGFKTTSYKTKKWRFFGKDLYVIEIEFVPGELFLKKLLEEALAIEDYYNADAIQRMINIRKNG